LGVLELNSRDGAARRELAVALDSALGDGDLLIELPLALSHVGRVHRLHRRRHVGQDFSLAHPRTQAREDAGFRRGEAAADGGLNDAAGARVGNDAARQLDGAAKRVRSRHDGPDRENPLRRLRHEDRPVRLASGQVLSAGGWCGHRQALVGKGLTAVVAVGRESARCESEGHDNDDQGRGRQVAPPAHQQREGDAEEEAGPADSERQWVGLFEVALKIVGRREPGRPGRGAGRGRCRRRFRNSQLDREQIGASVHRHGEEHVVLAGMLAPVGIEPVAAVRKRQSFGGSFRRFRLDDGVRHRFVGAGAIEEHDPAGRCGRWQPVRALRCSTSRAVRPSSAPLVPRRHGRGPHGQRISSALRPTGRAQEQPSAGRRRSKHAWENRAFAGGRLAAAFIGSRSERASKREPQATVRGGSEGVLGATLSNATVEMRANVRPG
jgi:hypothetical protein